MQFTRPNDDGVIIRRHYQHRGAGCGEARNGIRKDPVRAIKLNGPAIFGSGAGLPSEGDTSRSRGLVDPWTVASDHRHLSLVFLLAPATAPTIYGGVNLGFNFARNDCSHWFERCDLDPCPISN